MRYTIFSIFILIFLTSCGQENIVAPDKVLDSKEEKILVELDLPEKPMINIPESKILPSDKVKHVNMEDLNSPIFDSHESAIDSEHFSNFIESVENWVRDFCGVDEGMPTPAIEVIFSVREHRDSFDDVLPEGLDADTFKVVVVNKEEIHYSLMVYIARNICELE